VKSKRVAISVIAGIAGGVLAIAIIALAIWSVL
jgi:hypothetical protein